MSKLLYSQEGTVTCELGGVNTTKRQLCASICLGSEEKTEQRGEALSLEPSKQPARDRRHS